MILINNGSNPFRCNGFVLHKGVKTQVPDDIAEEFLKIKGVEKYIAPADVAKEKAKADEAIAKLEAENAELKAELEAIKAEKAKADEAIALEAAKAEATELGIQFAPNISLPKLQEKIAAKKAEQ